jgi:hypothetical protein
MSGIIADNICCCFNGDFDRLNSNSNERNTTHTSSLLPTKEATRILPSVVVTAGLFLITAGYIDQPIAPMFGLLGTIAVYLQGKSSKTEENPSSLPRSMQQRFSSLQSGSPLNLWDFCRIDEEPDA